MNEFQQFIERMRAAEQQDPLIAHYALHELIQAVLWKGYDPVALLTEYWTFVRGNKNGPGDVS